mmetsp:Transcript_1859/g.2611  ORF Transcript_1859/g.2611 Transcript_1859/m.2611 type:complete len:281 (-) Transcript_1859:118-960(-)|eukprot:CAMPEP_0196594042 /NCGR_PEP_ID=MMETSP1081-20130531/77216_1 /TAXON_ID=36882 /ORGANISM="Pyramimonas amylifera, Strain CCMP720" /LENGTH=280 /DNA_ID=CAMNT_0041918193 /DNA_START=283 /DNA_END=1125 /DNA_ORIENTATION=+
MGRNYRKRTALADGQAEAEEAKETVNTVDSKIDSGGNPLGELLMDTKLLQKRRKKEKGVTTDTLSGFAAKGLQLIQVYEEDQDDEMEALGDTFANETAVTEEDPNMEKYIEEEVRKRRGLAGGGGEEGLLRATTEVQDLQADLYRIPDNLKVRKPIEEDGSDRWMTGIVEVQLPVAHRLQNIEATEKAKASMLDSQKMRRFGNTGPKTTPLPASLSANYSLHRSHFSKQGAGGGGRTTTEQEYNGRQGGANVNSNRARGPTATDDVVASRFKARERQRRR